MLHNCLIFQALFAISICICLYLYIYSNLVLLQTILALVMPNTLVDKEWFDRVFLSRSICVLKKALDILQGLPWLPLYTTGI